MSASSHPVAPAAQRFFNAFFRSRVCSGSCSNRRILHLSRSYTGNSLYFEHAFSNKKRRQFSNLAPPRREQDGKTTTSNTEVTQKLGTGRRENKTSISHGKEEDISLQPQTSSRSHCVSDEHAQRLLQKDPKTGETLKKIMSHAVQPIALIIAAARASGVDGDDPRQVQHFRAMTISSLTSVTLDPDPFVSFNIRAPSHTFDALEPYFNIQFLPCTEDAVKVAHMFTLGNAPESLKNFGHFGLPGLEWEAGKLPRFPVIEASCLTCQLHSTMGVGDHVIVVAKVLRATFNDSLSSNGYLRYGNRNYYGFDQSKPMEGFSKWQHQKRARQDIEFAATRIKELIERLENRNLLSELRLLGLIKSVNLNPRGFKKSDLLQILKILSDQTDAIAKSCLSTEELMEGFSFPENPE